MEAHINGTTLHYSLEGPADAPCVTFAHALANNMTLWDRTASKLKDRYRVLRYDQRGHGASPATPAPYTFPMLMSDAVALLDAVGIGKTHWVGLSIGGMIGYGLAIDHGDRLRSLVACDSRPDAPPDYAVYFQSRIDKAAKAGMDGVVESTIERWFTPESLAAKLPVLDQVRSMIRTTDPVGHEGCCEALKTLSFGPRLNEIRVPTLILGGEKDKGAPPEILAKAARLIPGAEHAIIPGAGHITALENPAAFEAVLEDFISRH